MGDRIRIRPLFAWFDLWIGVFIDRPRRRVYVFPLPCLGIVIDWAPGSDREEPTP